MERKTEKLLRKIHIKDYTNSLEKVLEEKFFSIDTKNLLLSMVYKIENSYKDYEKTKVQVCDKCEFLEEIINIIKNDCNEIIITNEPIEKNKLFKIDKKNKKIITLGNELVLLQSILTIGQKKIKLPEEENTLEPAISYFMNTANCINQSEVIRDFNGWSWDILGQNIENKKINITFQILIYLLDYQFIKNWLQNNSSLADYLILMKRKLEEDFGKTKALQIVEIFYKIAIEENAKNNKEELEKWNNIKNKTQIEFNKLENKAKYIEELTKEKKKLTKKIEEIDILTNNIELLKKEYEKRNAKLSNEEKIFSVRQLNNKLEIERQEYVDKIKEYNNLIEPKIFIKRKTEVEKKYKFLLSLNLNANENEISDTIKLCNLFLECFKIKIMKATTKQEIVKYIYELRYFRFIFINDKVKLKDVITLKEKFEKTIKMIYERAREINAIEDVTKDENANYTIIHQIFDSKMIDLNNMVIETKIEEGRLFIEYYDTNILETRIELQCNKTIKLNKKTKLFS